MPSSHTQDPVATVDKAPYEVPASSDWAKLGIGVLCLVIGVVLMTATSASFPGALLFALGCVSLCATVAPADHDASSGQEFMECGFVAWW